jgi:hypothetical protein
MSRLRATLGYAKGIALILFRMQVIIMAAWGIYGVIVGHGVLAAALIVPVVYFGRFIWRGYQDGATQQEKKVAD